MDTILLPLSLIVIDPDYATAFPPMPDEEYMLLKEDIRRSGMHTPIIVSRTRLLPRGQEQTYTVLAGHTRHKIHQELGLDSIRATVVVTAEEKVSALFDNVYRRQLDKATIGRSRAKEAEIRRKLHERLIPSLQPIFKFLPPEVQSSLTLASEEHQEQFMEEFSNVIRLTPRKSGLPSGPSTRGLEPPVEIVPSTQQLKTKLAELEEALKQEQKSSLHTHNKLSRELEDAREERQHLEDRIATMKAQLQSAQGEVNAARIVADERLGRTVGLTDTPPTPQLLLHGLDYAQQLMAHLTLSAAKLPALNQADALTAHQALRTITTHLDQLHELLLPTHDGLLPDGRNGNGLQGGTLALVSPRS